MSNQNRIYLGVIIGAKGIRGEVRIKSFTQSVDDIDSYGILEDEAGTRKFNVKVRGISKGSVFASIDGVTDRNMAEALVGTKLYVSRDRLPSLDEEEFYHADLIGLKAIDEDGVEVGVVSAIYDFGAGDVIEIKLLNSNKTELIPFTESYVPQINISEGYIIITSVLLNFAKDDEDEG